MHLSSSLRRHRARALACLVPVTFVACSSSSEPIDAGLADAAATSDANVDADVDANVYTGPLGDPDLTVGAFSIELEAPTSDRDGYTSAFGKVYDGETPTTVQWTVQATNGDCQLLVPVVPYCEAGCGSSAACVADGVCQDYPTSHQVGAVHVAGVTTAARVEGFDMVAGSSSNVYQPVSGTSLGYDAVEEGRAITLTAAGNGFTGAFAITAPGIAPLVLTNTAIALAHDVDVPLTWTPPADESASTIHVHLDISHHGGTRGEIECDTADDGSLTLGGDLIGALLDLGVAGFPTIVVTRSTVASTVISAGSVELEVTAGVETDVSIDGIVSCNEDADCPDGQTCIPAGSAGGLTCTD